ncbi:MAG: flagellar biosynthetic protein FliR [Marinosulfonomonas sp.]|nr:flagellar biosynthetic protein FliR [Marinosulfonomonas sp.]
MTELLSLVSEVGDDALLIVFFVFLRVGAAVAILPVVGEQSIPKRVRLVIALCFTAIITPAVFSLFSEVEPTFASALSFLFSEVISGLAIGLSLRLFIHSLQIAGSIAAQSTSLSQIFGGAAAEPQPAIGHLFLVAGLAIAVSFGLHVQAVELLVYSYEILEPGRFPDGAEFSAWGVHRIGRAFGLAFSLAAPFVIASLIYNTAMGVINRAMPQLMVSFVGAPAITAGGLVLLFVTTPLILRVWMSALTYFLNNPFGISP